MSHPIYRVLAFERIAPYTLRVKFDDTTERLIDFRPILAGEVYGPLRDPTLFNQVQVDPEVHTLVWSNGADFDPATLHDWPEHLDALLARARHWESVSTSEEKQVNPSQASGVKRTDGCTARRWKTIQKNKQ